MKTLLSENRKLICSCRHPDTLKECSFSDLDVFDGHRGNPCSFGGSGTCSNPDAIKFYKKSDEIENRIRLIKVRMHGAKSIKYMAEGLVYGTGESFSYASLSAKEDMEFLLKLVEDKIL